MYVEMRSTLIGLLVALALPATASARGQTVAPPGNSGVNQYVESVPTAKGNRPTATISPGGGGGNTRGGTGNTGGGGSAGRTSAASGNGAAGGGASPLTPSAQRALARQGSRGRQVAALAAATGPGRARDRSRAGTSTRATIKPRSQVLPANDSSPPSAVLRALTGASTHGGLGLLLPAILILGTLCAGLIALRRRRVK